jgi:uncharacterized membrane protein
MRQFNSSGPMYSFNIFLAMLFFLAFLILPFIFVKKIYQSEADDLEENYRYLIYALKKTLPQRFNTFVYFIRNILFVIFIVAPFESPKAQTLLLASLNLIMLVYLLVTRPFK